MDTEQIDLGRVPNVMVVDDSPTNLRVMSVILLELGIEPQPISNGKLALAAAKANPPDLILLDISMPGMDGYAVCSSLKRDEQLKDIPVIFISGLSDGRDIVRGLSMGGVDYVARPFLVEEVAARIRVHLKILSLQRRLSAQNEDLEKIVVERTRELAVANERLKEMGRIKDDFLRMIAHEIRTPANGLLGMADLIIGSSEVPSEAFATYRRHYELSKQRLLNLIEDSALILETTDATGGRGEAISFGMVLDGLRARQPGVRATTDPSPEARSLLVHADESMVLRALETAALLAFSFRSEGKSSPLTVNVRAERLALRFDLDALGLSESAAEGFFELESPARSSSRAEPLGLSPVVAHKIVAALGGSMRLVKTGANEGYLEVVLPIAEGS